MVEYTDEDLKRATSIIESLGGGGKGEAGEHRPEGLEDGLSIVDIEEHAEQFYDELELLGEAGFDFPAVNLGGRGLVPVSIGPVAFPGFGAWVWSWRRMGMPAQFWRDALEKHLRGMRARLGEEGSLKLPEARETFVSRASEFLAMRLAAVRMSAGSAPPDQPPPVLTMAKRIGGPSTKVAGCHFEVHTVSPGLSAYWSGAYFLTSNYHGAPTTPAIGVLQAGTYVFGINGGAYGSTVKWDKAKVCTLPGMAKVHLPY